MKTPEAIAQECALEVAITCDKFSERDGCRIVGRLSPIIAAAIREATEPLKLELASETARANALRDDVFRLREELHDANTTLGQMRISEDAWLVERDALRGEATRLAAEVERLKAELGPLREIVGVRCDAESCPSDITNWMNLVSHADAAKRYKATLDVAEGAGKALIARLEATHGQAFYDVVKPELIALEVALARIAALKEGKA